MGGAGFVAVGIGAALGAWLRWWLGVMLNALNPNLPYGTLAANLIGGYLIGIADHRKENGRSDLILVDTRDLAAGPVARIKMPYRVVGQVHGFWVPGDQLPKEA